MDQVSSKSVSWGDDEFLESTSDPSVSMSVVGEEMPAMTVATIVGVIVVMLFAIVAVFLLGVLIDCRQQRVLAKMGEARRLKQQRKMHVNTHPEDDGTSIVNNIEEVGMSQPPASVLRDIP